jgi:hypothetical protein
MDLIKKENEQQMASVLKNPFKSEKLRKISIDMWYYPVAEHNRIDATVRFENDKTSGSQKFEEKDLFTLITKIDVFVKSL